jgi:hypothetical protein
VYTGWENNGRNFIGTVTARNDLWDAAVIDTSSTGTTAGLEWDGVVSYFYLAVDSSAYSHNGDSVCQDGFTDGVICGIKVNKQDLYWTGSNGIRHRGVEGHNPGLTAVQVGDSGGLVFAITGNTRQARGIVSYGGENLIRWTEVLDIYHSHGLKLAP